jgi:hypothetical protein
VTSDEDNLRIWARQGGKQERIVRAFETLAANTMPDDYRLLFEQRLETRREPRNVKVILMFGPCHGTTMELAENAKECIAIARDEIDIGRNFSGASREEIVQSTRIGRHRYRYDQMYSSMNGEDCALFVHDENCCEKTFPEPAQREPRQKWIADESRQGIRAFGDPNHIPRRRP